MRGYLAYILQNQEQLFAQISAPFANNDVTLKYLRGTERISQPFEFQAAFSSSNNAINLDKALGTQITITMKSDSQERYIDGIITEFSQTSVGDGRVSAAEYTAVIRPSLWLLTLDKNYLIFQNKSTIDIIKQVLKDNGIQDIEDKTTNCGRVIREYCVQYGESSFNFISRLMEAEGIFYFFRHTKGKHVLVLADSTNGYANLQSVSQVDYIQGSQDVVPLNKIFNTKLTASVNSGSYSSVDYNYTISQTKLFSKLNTQWQGKNIYDYPGGYGKLKDGDNLAKLRVQEFEFTRELFGASTTSANLVPGHYFSVQGHYSDRFNKKYVAYFVEHNFVFDVQEGSIYQNEILAFDEKTNFRPPRITSKPKIYGSQTAVVTGPSGEEIFRNEYCGIKVHFYWDQVGKNANTDSSSCWIRVAQLLAGSGWGAVFVPRIGQEVVVTFLDGDPDKPLITGCVYNDQYMPPYSDKESMKSTLKTVTFKDDKGFNEFRLNDEKDKEEIYLHAQKDLNECIENSRTININESNDSLTLLKGSKSIILKSDEGKTAVKYQLSIDKGDQIIELKEGNLGYTITKGNSNIKLSEGNNAVLLEKGDNSLTLKNGNLTVTLSKGNVKYDIKGDCTFEISGNLKIKADKNINIEAGQNLTIKSGQNLNAQSGTACNIKAGTAAAVKSGTDLNLTAGTNGKFAANMNLNLSANMNCAIKANIAASMQGTVSAKVAGTMVEISGSAMTKVSGPMITVGGGMVQLG